MNIKTVLCGTTPDSSPATLILRVFTGAALMTHGIPKLFGGLPQFTEYVAGLGVPAPQLMAFLAAFSESIGALLLAVGLLTRPAAFLIACTMAVAALGAHGTDGFAAQEKAWLYFVPAIFFIIKGAGNWSIDALLSKK